MRSPIRVLAGAGLLLAGLNARAGTLTIFHTNDLQGQLLPAPYFDEADRGGFPRLLHLLGQAAGDSAALVVDAGDATGPSQLSSFDAGRLVWELMAAAGYSAAAIGNHEFDFGLDTLKARAAGGVPLLGANLTVEGQRLFTPYLLVERQGLRLALIGLLSPSAEKLINPRRNPGVKISEPGAALRQALDEIGDRADYRIALVHMSEEEARQLAGDFPEVRLFIGGGSKSPRQKGEEVHLLRLANGARLAATPGSAFLGRIELQLERRGEQVEEVGFRAALIPLDPSVPEDSATAARLAEQGEAFARARGAMVGRTREEIADTPQLLADLIRTRAGAEVGILNLGTLRPRPLDGTITEAIIDELIRFDDVLVESRVKGAELRRLAGSSKGRQKEAQRLVFSGYDPATDKVSGRPLISDEVYRIATTAFLAEGGDGYFQPGALRLREGAGEATLREVLVGHLQAYPDLGRWDGIPAGPGGIWKSQTKLNGSLTRTGTNAAAGRYSGVSFLGGKNAMAWNSLVDVRANREAARGTLAAHLRSSFGQVQEAGRFKEAADRLQAEAVYTWQKKQPAPFVSLDLNTVWTGKGGTPRPLTLRGSSGLHRSLGRNFKVRLGVGVERNLASHNQEVGIEAVPEYRRQLPNGNSLSSNMKIFMGATQTRKLSVQHYNSLLIRLAGNLYATMDLNLFLHRDSQVDRLAFKSEAQVGLGYTWERKWF